MTGKFDKLKSRVRAARSAGKTYDLSYTQHLEVAGRLTFNAPSLNHLKAQPDQYTWFEPGTFRDILASVQSVSPMLPKQSGNEFLPAGYGEYEIWQTAAQILLDSMEWECEDPLADILMMATDLDPDKMPRMVNDGRITSILEPDQRLPSEERLKMVVAFWLTEEYKADGPMLLGLWERMGKMARAHGMNEEAAQLYRSICREAHNHSWSVQSQVALGLLDIPLEKATFLKRAGNSENALETMELIWEEEEPMEL